MISKYDLEQIPGGALAVSGSFELSCGFKCKGCTFLC